LKTIDIDLREQMKHIVITTEKNYPVKMKNVWRVMLGLRLIGLGCWLCGITHEEGKIEEDKPNE
jgi:hypothetical protein